MSSNIFSPNSQLGSSNNSKINKTRCVTKKIINDDTKNKISEGLKAYYCENKNHSNRIYVKLYQFNNDNIFLNEYNSISRASFVTKVPRKMISLCMNGKIKIAGGFIWKYA
jgi:hypothetical protein